MRDSTVVLLLMDLEVNTELDAHKAGEAAEHGPWHSHLRLMQTSARTRAFAGTRLTCSSNHTHPRRSIEFWVGSS